MLGKAAIELMAVGAVYPISITYFSKCYFYCYTVHVVESLNYYTN